MTIGAKHSCVLDKNKGKTWAVSYSGLVRLARNKKAGPWAGGYSVTEVREGSDQVVVCMPWIRKSK